MTRDVYDSIRKIMEEQWEEAASGMSWSESMFDHKWSDEHNEPATTLEADGGAETPDSPSPDHYPADFEARAVEPPEPVAAPTSGEVAAKSVAVPEAPQESVKASVPVPVAAVEVEGASVAVLEAEPVLPPEPIQPDVPEEVLQESVEVSEADPVIPRESASLPAPDSPEPPDVPSTTGEAVRYEPVAPPEPPGPITPSEASLDVWAMPPEPRSVPVPQGGSVEVPDVPLPVEGEFSRSELVSVPEQTAQWAVPDWQPPEAREPETPDYDFDKALAAIGNAPIERTDMAVPYGDGMSYDHLSGMSARAIL